MTAIDSRHVVIEPLLPHHNRAAFCSGVDVLDRYLRQQANQDARRHVAATFVLVEGIGATVLGFYTLSATSVKLGDLPDATARRLPKYPLVPAILLGRLAVDRGQLAGRVNPIAARSKTRNGELSFF